MVAPFPGNSLLVPSHFCSGFSGKLKNNKILNFVRIKLVSHLVLGEICYHRNIFTYARPSFVTVYVCVIMVAIALLRLNNCA